MSGEEKMRSREEFGGSHNWTVGSLLLLVGLVTMMVVIVVLLLYCSYKHSSQVTKLKNPNKDNKVLKIKVNFMNFKGFMWEIF